MDHCVEFQKQSHHEEFQKQSYQVLLNSFNYYHGVASNSFKYLNESKSSCQDATSCFNTFSKLGTTAREKILTCNEHWHSN